jgi:hypothetical protein
MKIALLAVVVVGALSIIVSGIWVAVALVRAVSMPPPLLSSDRKTQGREGDAGSVSN